MGRYPPHSDEAERGVLGCILLQPNECMGECIERLKPGPAVFYDLRHQVIYELLSEMYDKKEAIDIITVHQRLKDRQQLESVGGLAYLAPLPDVVSSAGNVVHYINIILEKFLLRQILKHCVEHADRAYAASGEEVTLLIEDFEKNALAVAESVTSNVEAGIKEIIHARINFYEECSRNGGGLLGLPTGYYDLDRMTDGLRPGDMIVIAARPSQGKTAIAMNIADHVAVAQGVPVGVFSLEMSRESLVGRMISARSRVNERTLIKGCATQEEQKRLITATAKLANAPIFIDDSAGLTITQLRARARRFHRQHGVKLFIIDYLQLLRTARRRDNRREEVDEISTGIKAMAKELNVPVVAVCQLNREIEKDKERKPRVSDLRESGQVEQDADLIGLLYAADPEAARNNSPVLPMNLLIAKARNGPTGDVPLIFFKEYTRFEQASKVQ